MSTISLFYIFFLLFTDCFVAKYEIKLFFRRWPCSVQQLVAYKNVAVQILNIHAFKVDPCDNFETTTGKFNVNFVFKISTD